MNNFESKTGVRRYTSFPHIPGISFAGFGAAMVFTPAYIMVGQYFDKRKGMAMSLGTIGAGLGAAVFGPSITFMMHNFGYMGCMLILAAVEFHCCIAGSLLRPFVERSSPVVEVEIQVVASKSDINKVDDNKLANAKQDKTRGRSAITSYIKLFSSATRIFYFASITSLPMAFGVVIYFMPDAAMLSGYTDTEGAWLLSVFGICDVIGRLFWGFMFDLKVLRRRRSISFALLGWSCVVLSCLLSVTCISMVLLAGLVIGVVVVCMSTAREYWHFICFAVTFGFFSGGFHSQRMTIISEFVPTNLHSNAVGFSVFFQGVGNLLISPIGGKLSLSVT